MNNIESWTIHFMIKAHKSKILSSKKKKEYRKRIVSPENLRLFDHLAYGAELSDWDSERFSKIRDGIL